MKKLVFIFLLFFAGCFSYLGSNLLLSLMHYFTLLVSIISFLIFISKNKLTGITFCVFLYTFIYPIYASVQSSLIFGQPFYMGIGSLRYIMMFLFGYFLLINKYNYSYLLKQINCINVTVAAISVILILILGVSPSSIYAFEVTNNVLDTGGGGDTTIGVGGAEVRGVRFSACSTLMIISWIYYLIASLKCGGKKNWIPFIILMVYLLFVHKGRQPLAVLGVIYVIYLLKMYGISVKRMCMIVLPIIFLMILLIIDDNILFRFTTILDGEKSEDFSTLARIDEMKKIWPYIENNFLLGVGNLSAHFRNGGFQTFFGRQFYLSDLGIVAALATGGIVLVLIYCGIYTNLWKRTRYVQDFNTKMFMRYMIISFLLLLLFFCNDYLSPGGTIVFTLVFYPLYKKRYISKCISYPLRFIRRNKDVFV